MQDLSYENEFDFHENELTSDAHFHKIRMVSHKDLLWHRGKEVLGNGLLARSQIHFVSLLLPRKLIAALKPKVAAFKAEEFAEFK